MPEILKLGIPKGSLQEATLSLFARAGFSFYGSERTLWLSSNDPEISPVMLRPQEIPMYVADGSLDCGLSGLDWIKERNCEGAIRVLADLCYSKRSFRPVRWVLAVANEAPWQTVRDLKAASAAKPLRVSTELKAITEAWLAEKAIQAEVDFSWGATEAKVPVFADAIVECTETGSSLRENGLRILDTVLESTTRFFANRDVCINHEWKRTKLDAISILLKSCLAADKRVSVRVESPRDATKALQALIPSDAAYSVLEGNNGCALLEIIIDKERSRDLLPLMARNGASRISVASLSLLYE